MPDVIETPTKDEPIPTAIDGCEAKLGRSSFFPKTKLRRQWWKESVAYQIYPRSFQDSNGDGIGDIGGRFSAPAFREKRTSNSLFF